MYASAEDFLAAIDTCDAGCAVVDLELGKMSGFELALPSRHGRGKDSASSSSVAPADETARASAMALGCIEYLRKPFMPIELLDAIFRATQDTARSA